MKINNKKILNNHLETISGIADRGYQKRVWICGEGPEVDDYTESICHFFDDGDPIISHYKNYGITDRQLFLLTSLRKAVQEFTSKIKFELGPDFLCSPEWIKITVMAKEVLGSFDYHNQE